MTLDRRRAYFTHALAAELPPEGDLDAAAVQWLRGWTLWRRRVEATPYAQELVVATGAFVLLLLLRPPFVMSYTYSSKQPWLCRGRLSWPAVVAGVACTTILFALARRAGAAATAALA